MGFSYTCTQDQVMVLSHIRGELTIAPVKIFQISLFTNSVGTSCKFSHHQNFISQPLSLTQPYHIL